MKLLVIPHHYSPHLVIREIELARCWAERHEVYVIRPPLMNGERTRSQKLRFHLSATRTRFDLSPHGFYWMTLPALYRLPSLHPFVQQIALRSLLKKYHFDVVINSSYWGNYSRPGQIGAEIPRGDYKYIFDLVDDHVGGYELYGQSNEANQVDKIIRQEIEKADEVVTITNYLGRLCRDRYGRDSKVIPNGFHPPKIPEDLSLLRERFGLKVTPTLGYIGSLDGWVDLDFAIRIFLTLRGEIPELQFLVVGGGSKKNEIQEKYSNERKLFFTGPVPRSEVGDYFQLINLGLIPFEENPLTHASLPIKALEYGAYGKRVIASSLKGLREMQFPHINCFPMKAEVWCQEIKKLLSEKGSIDSRLLNPYQWSCLARKMEALF